MQHVAIFFTDFRVGGVETMRVRMANELISRGYRVDVVVLNDQGPLRSRLDPLVNVKSLGAARIRQAAVPLYRYLRRAQPDGLLADTWPLTAVAAMAVAASRVSTRLVVADHTTLSGSPLYRSARRRMAIHASVQHLYPIADAVVGVSQGVVDDLRNMGFRGPNAHVIWNAAATGCVTKGQPDPWPANAGLRILNIGSLREQKDQGTLLRAMADVLAQKRSTLRILGRGPDLGTLEILASSLAIAEDVNFLGFVEDPAPWYEHADVFVLSSQCEGFGNVLVEALEHGIPVVSTDCPSGPREILRNGDFGALVPVGDARALADQILNAHHQLVTRQERQERAAEFEVAAVADRYLELLLK